MSQKSNPIGKTPSYRLTIKKLFGLTKIFTENLSSILKEFHEVLSPKESEIFKQNFALPNLTLQILSKLDLHINKLHQLNTTFLQDIINDLESRQQRQQEDPKFFEENFPKIVNKIFEKNKSFFKEGLLDKDVSKRCKMALPNRSPKSAKYCLDFHKRSSRRKKSVKF